MAWWDLLEATADAQFREPYERVLEYSLGACGGFLAGHPDRCKVMDRLHAFLYFLEGLLPNAHEPRCAAAIRDGIGRAAHHLREIAPEFGPAPCRWTAPPRNSRRKDWRNSRWRVPTSPPAAVSISDAKPEAGCRT